MTSKWFQMMWGDRIKMDKDMKSAYGITSGGQRVSTSISGTLLGLGGDCVIIDDPHNTENVESDPERETALRGWRELRSTRLNDPQQSAIVVVMQRLHANDVSGDIIASDEYPLWTHLMFPMRHDPRRHCWCDPREGDELMWPVRYDESSVRRMEINLGPYMASGRLQQSPTPEGGGIIKDDWWKLWPPEEWQQDESAPIRYPNMKYIVAICDTAYTEQKENDPSACVVLGVFSLNGISKIMLMEAWAEHLEFNTLLERIIKTCKKRKVDALLIEGKASGKSILQEIRRRCGPEEFMVKEIQPDGDKVARTHAVVPMFSSGCVYAPDRAWSAQVIDEMSQFPKGKHDDLHDCVVYGVSFLRKSGIALLPDEGDRVSIESYQYDNMGSDEPLYDV